MNPEPENKLQATFRKIHLNGFRTFANLLQFLRRKKLLQNDERRLEPLLPVADQETYERYAPAFSTIVEKPVTCVAVTGPYGAGKTSLINAFIENYPKLKFIRISLATFEGDDEKTISSDRIEKSILQQLIYSAGRKKLEYSRFKKIRKPRWLHAKAILLSLFAVSTGAAIIYWKNIEGFLATASRWQEFAIAGTGGTFWLLLLFLIAHGILKASAGLSIKKFSLKNAEIETEDRSKESVFNKHLDEIVYFFQETPCDIVIIEDLDRFGKTEIFTKIREINQLINTNPDVRHKKRKQIVFLFAIRDDLFQGKDRTKFFDLLIPVIPFVSAGNAYDALHNKLVKAGLRDSLRDKFLRQITVYVTDNRHLVNIVNEYSVYLRNISDTNLDPNKLFAIILYKVFFPSDFGKLHMNEGVLAGLVRGLQEKKRLKREHLNEQLEQIKEAQKQINEGQINSRDNLIYSYIGLIQHRSDPPARAIVSINAGHQVSLNSDTDSILNILKISNDIRTISSGGYNSLSFNVAELGKTIHPGLSLAQRIETIDRNTRLLENGIEKTRVILESQLRDARYMPVNQAFSAEEIRDRSSIFDHGDLFAYLVIEGYLGENYDDYTSHFHKGATTRSDREYVQRFNQNDEIDWSEKIDTPSEVILILDDGLFGKPQGFNITLVDHVLSSEPSLQSSLIEGLKSFQNKAFQFLQAYYLDGKHVEKLLQILLTQWEGFPDTAAACESPIPHVKNILENAREEIIANLREPSRFTEFIGKNAPEIFDHRQLADRISLLTKSGILFEDISFPNLSADDRKEAISIIIENTLWNISSKNIITILTWLGIDINTAHSEMFMSILKGPRPVVIHVEENIESFVNNCFLEIQTTIAEPREGIEKMLSLQDLSEEVGKRIIARQETRLKFSEVSSAYWDTIIEESKYVIEWDNFDILIENQENLPRIESIFESIETATELAKQQQEIHADLFDFLIDFDEMELAVYQVLIGPHLGKISHFPTTIDHAKKLHLIQSEMVELNESAANWLKDDPALLVALIETRFTRFEEIENWHFDEDEISGLLKSRIPIDAKRKILIDAGTIDHGGDVALQKEIIDIFKTPDTSIDNFDEDLVESIIHIAPVDDAIGLLIQMIPKWEESRVMNSLKAIGSPYEEVAEYGKRPTIPESKINVDLAEALQERGIISQFKREDRGLWIITKRNDPS